MIVIKIDPWIKQQQNAPGIWPHKTEFCDLQKYVFRADRDVEKRSMAPISRTQTFSAPRVTFKILSERITDLLQWDVYFKGMDWMDASVSRFL